RHTRFSRDWSSDVCSSDLAPLGTLRALYDQEKGRSLTGLPLVRLGLALALQGDVRRGDAAIADGFALDPGKRPRWLGDYSSAIRSEERRVGKGGRCRGTGI